MLCAWKRSHDQSSRGEGGLRPGNYSHIKTMMTSMKTSAYSGTVCLMYNAQIQDLKQKVAGECPMADAKKVPEVAEVELRRSATTIDVSYKIRVSKHPLSTLALDFNFNHATDNMA